MANKGRTLLATFIVSLFLVGLAGPASAQTIAIDPPSAQVPTVTVPPVPDVPDVPDVAINVTSPEGGLSQAVIKIGRAHV